MQIRLVGGVMVLAASFLQIAEPASALELFGFQIFGEDEPDSDKVEILDPLDYTVSPEILTSEGKLRRRLLAASDVWQRRNEPASGSAGLIVAAKADYRRLLATLYTEGHYAGAISILLNGVEAGDLPNTSQLRAPVSVTLSVDPGPGYRFGTTRVENPPSGFILGSDWPPGTVRSVFASGDPARADVIDDVGEEAVDLWRSKGHPLAVVTDREVVANHATNTVDALIVLEPGQQASLEEPSVRGSKRVPPGFIRYMTGLSEGEGYSPEALDRARARLTRLGVFRSVRLVEGTEIGEDGLLPITVDVQDRKPRRVGVGATLSSLDGIGLEAFWLHRNVLGRAERLRFDAKVGGIDDVRSVSDYDYLASVSYRVPGVFNPDTDLEVGASAEQNVFDIYRDRSVSAYVGFRRIFTPRLDGSLFLDTSYSRVEDEIGTREFLTFAVESELTFDKRDNPTDATRGYYLSGEVTPFYEVEFESLAVRSELDARGYLSFGATRGTVLAARIGIGSVLGGALRELPPDQLFFSGGGGSVRGYGFRSIGTEVGGDTLGGRSFLELSAEYRQRITESFGMVAFVDSGFVSNDTLPFAGYDPRIGVGLGLRYNTGLGPLRLDIGTPVDRRPNDPRVAFYIGLGQAF